jgi:hypothetical protein
MHLRCTSLQRFQRGAVGLAKALGAGQRPDADAVTEAPDVQTPVAVAIRVGPQIRKIQLHALSLHV